MKYLLSYKIFEQSEKTYTNVPLSYLYSDYDSNQDDIKYYKISESTISRILSEFPRLRVGDYNNLWMHRTCATTFWESSNKFDCDIYEISDEWYYLECHVKNSHYIYKCDQLDGLFDCIRDIFNSFG